MGKMRLIAGGVSWAILVTAVSFDPVAAGESLDESEQWQRFSERCASDSLKTLPPAEDHRDPDPCDGGIDCAANVLARSEEGWTPNVAGRYTATSAGVLMAGTDHAIRFIEFSPAKADEDDGWTPVGAP